MPAWLTKAKNARRTSKAAQPFEIPCACGAAVRGRRTQLWQIVKCPDCGGRVFVLPADVYPRPASQPGKKQPGATGSAADEAPPRRRWRTRVREAAVGGGRALGKGAGWSLRRVRSQLTPFRIVVLGIVAAVGVTLYVVALMRARDQARVVLQNTPARAIAALESGNLAEAAAQYRLAADAVQRLGRTGPESRQFLQTARELEIEQQLAPESIYEMIRQAASLGLAQREGLLRKNYQDRWVIIDAPILRTGLRPDIVPQVDFPLVVEGRPVVLRGLDPLLAQFDGASPPERVIIAAQIRGAVSAVGRWTVTLDGNSAFLWSDPRTYRALGLGTGTPDDNKQLEKLLAAQAERLEEAS